MMGVLENQQKELDLIFDIVGTKESLKTLPTLQPRYGLGKM